VKASAKALLDLQVDGGGGRLKGKNDGTMNPLHDLVSSKTE
jgi:hypothetical protein